MPGGRRVAGVERGGGGLQQQSSHHLKVLSAMTYAKE